MGLRESEEAAATDGGVVSRAWASELIAKKAARMRSVFMMNNDVSCLPFPAGAGLFPKIGGYYLLMSQSDKTSLSPFPTTRWTLIRRAQKGGEAEAAHAMEEICRQYWYPIYAFARRGGFSAEDAEDLTQTFFQRLIASETILAARQEKGLLRTFMLALLKRVTANHFRHASAEKRGGSAAATLSLDDETAEERYIREPADIHDPDMLFDRAWAQGVLDAAQKKLRADFAKADNLESFDQLSEFLPLGDNATPYAEAAARLAISEATLRLQIHRMRKRYGKLIEEEITHTVNDPAEVKTELAHLMAVIGR
jgi:DNA-directed RNA polymerase specialized sigma24 family protein